MCQGQRSTPGSGEPISRACATENRNQCLVHSWQVLYPWALIYSPISYIERDFDFKVGLPYLSRPMGLQTQRIILTLSPGLRFTDIPTTLPSILCWYWSLISWPHDYMTTSLLTAILLDLKFFFIKHVLSTLSLTFVLYRCAGNSQFLLCVVFTVCK